jgi:putative transposase
MRDYECYYELGSQISQNLLRVLDKNWKSFFQGLKGYNKNPSKYLGRPKIPNYLPKDGRKEFALKNIQCRISDSKLIISFKPLKDFTVNTNVIGKLMQVRFIPKGTCYVCEIVYETEVPDQKDYNNRIASIDLGIDNFATISNNIGVKPIIINGRNIKSINQFYNKKKARLQSDLQLRHDKRWGNKLQQLTEKRNNKIDYSMHISSKMVINYCLENNIDTIIIGINKGWKQSSAMSKKNNQSFIQIPYFLFIQKIKYKAENYGMQVIETEESYTSGTSFIDNEEPNKKNYNKKRRIERGLFKSNDGILINADLNASYQIMKKVFPNVFCDGIEGVDLHPVRVNLTNV